MGDAVWLTVRTVFETLDATKGLFLLNAELPIPFDGWSRRARRADRHAAAVQRHEAESVAWGRQ